MRKRVFRSYRGFDVMAMLSGKGFAIVRKGVTVAYADTFDAARKWIDSVWVFRAKEYA